MSKHVFQSMLYSTTPCNYSHSTVITIHKHVDHYTHTHKTHTHTHTFSHLVAGFKVPAIAIPFHYFSQDPVIPLQRHPGLLQRRPPYVGKQMPQHSIQISRQSEDSQQASMMPQSMSQGQLQSSPRSSAQQQQQQASDVHAPHEACATTMLQSVRNSQNRQAKMQWTQQSSGKGGFCDPVELPLLRRLLSLLTDKLDLNFLCILCDTGVDGCFLGCSVVVVPVATDLVLGPDPPARILAPHEHVRVAPASPMPGWIPLPLLSTGVPVLLWRKPFWSLPASPSAVSEGTGCDSD